MHKICKNEYSQTHVSNWPYRVVREQTKNLKMLTTSVFQTEKKKKWPKTLEHKTQATFYNTLKS